MHLALACVAGTLLLVWLARSVYHSWRLGHERASQGHREYCARSGSVDFAYEFEPASDSLSPERAVKKRLLFRRGDWERN